MASNDDSTFGITGIPLPSYINVQTLTSAANNIPYVIGMPLRHEITDFANPSSDNGMKQWTLFVLALEQFKSLPVDDKLSYFQVAGIHGYPETPWDGAPAPKPDPTTQPGPGDQPFGGYCHHNTIAFPTWHRPYMLLYEQLLWKNMKDVITSWNLSDPDLTSWTYSADTFRLPYWDWAKKQQYTNDFALPAVFTQQTVPIWVPSSVASKYPNPFTYPNPLWGFDNPAQDPVTKQPCPFGKMPAQYQQWNIKDDHWPWNLTKEQIVYPWSQCSGVSRYGVTYDSTTKTYAGLEGVNNFQTANEAFSNFKQEWYALGKGSFTLGDAVNRLYSPDYNSTWGDFASTKWSNENETATSAGDKQTGFLSLEYIHNNVHNVTGGLYFNSDVVGANGVGHMADVPVAAFDPIFWLHHCNIDRLLAMWQALNWNLWWDKPEPTTGGTNVPDVMPDDPLTPFHTKDGGDPTSDFWTSNMARDWTKLNYQYDMLMPGSDAIAADGTLDVTAYQRDLEAYIQYTYINTADLVRSVTRDNRVKNQFFLGHDDGSWHDYFINVVYDRYALKGLSYAIQFYLGGDANNPASTFMDQENFIGQIYSFGGLFPASLADEANTTGGCANCGSQKDSQILSRGQVPITVSLIQQALDPEYKHIDNTNPQQVAEYLQNHLHWKFVQIGGLERDASEFPTLKVTVWAGTGKPRKMGDGLASLPPRYGGYQPVHKATEGKPGGALSTPA